MTWGVEPSVKSHLQELLDENDEHLFSQGACHVFADELFAHLAPYGFTFRRLADIKRATVQMQALHVYLGNSDVMFDVRGRQSEGSYFQEMRDYRLQNGGPVPDFRPLECSRDELFAVVEHYDDFEQGTRNRWGHFLDEEFVEKCQVRAKNLISQSPGKYDPRVQVSSA